MVNIDLDYVSVKIHRQSLRLRRIIAAAAGEPEASEQGNSLIDIYKQYIGVFGHFACKTQGIVVNGKIKGARQAG